MELKCSFCPAGTKKTDALKLRTINGRDYLLCRFCTKWGENHEVKPYGKRNVSNVQVESGK